jgi:uncharacterized protein (DUF952 family)
MPPCFARHGVLRTPAPYLEVISMTLVFKIERADVWESAQLNGTYNGSADDVRDGFIHLSVADQVKATLSKYFSNQQRLIVIAFDAADLGAALKWERSRDGHDFPHFYAPLPTAAAKWQRAIPNGTDGIANIDEAWLTC